MKKIIIIFTLTLISNYLLSQSSDFFSKPTMCYGFKQKPNTDVVTLKINVTNYGGSYFNIAKMVDVKKLFKNIKGLTPSNYALWFNIYDCNTNVPIQDNAVCQAIYIDSKTNKQTIKKFSVTDFLQTVKVGEELVVECVVLEKFPKGFFTSRAFDDNYITYIRQITRYVYK